MYADDLKSVLDGMELGAVERRDLQRFYQSPNGLNFLPVAKILLARGAVEEACDILEQGIGLNPKHFAAVGLYAELLFSTGQFEKAFDLIEPVQVVTGETIKIQLNKLKLALILNHNELVELLVAKLRPHTTISQEVNFMLEDMKTYGSLGVRDRLLAKLRENNRFSLSVTDNSELLESDLECALVPDSSCADSFFVAPLNDVFKSSMVPNESTWALSGDSLGLAKVYKEQGYLHKAYLMLERLVDLAPENTAVRLEWEDVKGLMMNQKIKDDSYSNSGISELEGLVSIERKISYLNTVLGRLDSYE